MNKSDVLFNKLLVTLFLLFLVVKGNKIPYESQNIYAQAPLVEYTVSSPEYLFISKLNLALPVSVSKIVNNEWEISDEISAFYGEGSSYPTQDGTTVVFAHARNGLFAQLPILEVGNTIVLSSKNHLFVYKVTHKELITPEQVDFLNHSGHNKLAIFTCFGFRDEYRIVFFADFVEEKAIEPENNNLYHM